VKEILKEESFSISQGKPAAFSCFIVLFTQNFYFFCYLFLLFSVSRRIFYICNFFFATAWRDIAKAKPLKIITGKGSHSLNQVSVLKPAIRKALVEDGWVVGTWDGGLIVNRRRT